MTDDSEARGRANVLMATLMPDGAPEDRARLLAGLTAEDYPLQMSVLLDKMENYLAMLTDSVPLLEACLQAICLMDFDLP